MGIQDSKNNLKNLVIVNDKNKIAKNGNFYYHASMHDSSEYNNNSKPFFEFNRKKFYATGIEPRLTVRNYTTDDIVYQYNFRNDDRTTDAVNKNIPVYIPQPNLSFSDQLRSTYSVVTTANGVATSCKPHVVDIQILATTDALHIFMLCDIISAYAPIEAGSKFDYNNIQDRQGAYTRVVVYQQHAIAGDGSLTVTPAKKTCFPMKNQNISYGSTLYGKYMYKNITIPSQNYNASKFIYHRDVSITDFDCGLAGTDIYCLVGKTNGCLEMYSCAITFTDDKDWKYRTNYTYEYDKFPEIKVEGTPFNIYSHYLDNSNFYMSYSYYENGLIKYEKLLCDDFQAATEWKLPYTVQRGDGLIVYYATTDKDTHINMIYDTFSGKRLRKIKGNTSIGNSYNNNVNITKLDLQWKYRMYDTENAPKLGFFTFDLKSIRENFAQSNDILFYKNDIKPLTIGISRYYNSLYETDTYKFYGNLNGDKIRSETTYVGTINNDTNFERTNYNMSLIRSGSYTYEW